MKIIHKDDLNQITFLDERFYQDIETMLYYPSVTTILDVYPKGYGFQQWLKDLGSNSEEVLKRAGDQGSHIHDAIDRFLRGEELKWVEEEKDNFTLDEWMMLLRFFDFYKTYKPKTIAVEISMVSPTLGCGGTLDYVCEMGGVIWYIDWKSGSAIHKTNKIQGAVYQKMWNLANPNQKIEKVACMHLRSMTRGEDKSGKQIQGQGWKLDEVEDTDHLFRLFEHAQVLWNEENPNPKPKNMIYPDRMSLEMLDDSQIKTTT